MSGIREPSAAHIPAYFSFSPRVDYQVDEKEAGGSRLRESSSKLHRVGGSSNFL